MKTLAFLLAFASACSAWQPGLFLGFGSIERRQYGPTAGESQSYTTLGLSLVHRIGVFEPFARAEFGRIHPSESHGSEEGPLLNAGFGLKARAPLPGGFGIGAGVGYAFLFYTEESVSSDMVGMAFHHGFEPSAGLRLDWKDRIYGEVEVPVGSDVEASFRLGVQPLAWFR